MEKYFQGVLILASVLFVLYREALVLERLRRLPRMQDVMGSNPTEGKIRFSQFTLFNSVECEKLFCKTNLKLKVLKLIKQNIITFFNKYIFLNSGLNDRRRCRLSHNSQSSSGLCDIGPSATFENILRGQIFN